MAHDSHSQPAPTAPAHPSRRRRRLILLGAALALLALLLLAVAFGPAVASSMAPGIIQSSAAQSIAGKVQVRKASIGWFSPARAEGVELLDPRSGSRVAQLDLDTNATLWHILSNRWWSAPALDLGPVTLKGNIAIEQDPSGETNLSRALAPPPSKPAPAPGAAPPSAPSSTAPSPGRSITATLKLDGLTLTRAETDSAGKKLAEAGVRDLQGDVALALDTRSGLTAAAKGKITGEGVRSTAGTQNVTFGDAALPGQTVIAVDVNVQLAPPAAAGAAPASAAAQLKQADVSIAVDNAPVAIVDALANLGGGLLDAAGTSANLRVEAHGNLAKLQATTSLRSTGLNLDLPLSIDQGVITIATPQDAAAKTLTLASTRGLSRMPALRPLFNQLNSQIRFGSWPSLELTVDQVRLPAPVSTSGAPVDLAAADWRGSGLRLRARLSEFTGQVIVPTPDRAPAALDSWQPFALEPVEFELAAADFAKELTARLATRATLNAQSAGAISANITAAGLLDSAGRLRAMSKDAQAPIDRLTLAAGVNNLSTALVAPFASASGIPIDLQRDIGDTANLSLNAALTPPDSAPGAKNALAGNASLRVESRNLAADAALVLKDSVLTTTDRGVHLSLASAGPLAAQIITPAPTASAPAAAPPIQIAGAGRADLTVTNLRADLSPFLSDAPAAPGTSSKLDALLASLALDATAKLSDLRVTLPPSPPAPPSAPPSTPPATQPAAASAPQPLKPIDLRDAELTLSIQPGAPTKARLAAALAVDNSPFTASGDLALAPAALLAKPGAGSPVERFLALQPNGSLALRDIPASITSVLPGAPALSAGAPRGSSDSADFDPLAAVVDLLGNSASVTLTLSAPKPDAPTSTPTTASAPADSRLARLVLETRSGVAGAQAVAALSPQSLTINSGSVFLKAEAASINPILARLAPAAPSQPGIEPARSLALANAATLWLRVAQPINVPLHTQSGALAPDLAHMSDAVITFASQGDPGIANIALGGDGSAASPRRYLDVVLRNLAGELRVPSGALTDAPTRPDITATLATNILRSDATPLADARANLARSGNRSNGDTTRALVTLDKINTAAVDQTLDLAGLFQGFVGDTAKVSVETQIATGNFKTSPASPAPATSSDMNLVLSVEAPRIAGANLRLVKSADRIALTEPATITITPDPAVLNRLAGSDRIADPARPNTSGNNNQDAGIGDKIRRLGEGLGENINNLVNGNIATGESAAKPATKVRVIDAAPLRLRIGALALAAAPSTPDNPGGPFVPGVFNLDAAFESPRLTLDILPLAADGSLAAEPTRATFNNLKGSAKSTTANVGTPTASSGASAHIEFTLSPPTTPPAPTTPQPNTQPSTPPATQPRPSVVDIQVADLAGPRGVLDLARARINANIDVEAFPTPLADRLANQGGLLTEVLGPTVTAKAVARNVTLAAPAPTPAPSAAPARQPLPSGTLEATLTAPRARMELQGAVDRGLFTQSGATRLEITEMRPQLVQLLAGSVPVVDSLEKSPADRPAVIEMTNFKAPLDGNLARLSGRISVDLGVTRFTTKSVFSRIVKAAGGKEQGTIGRRIEPFIVDINAGILDYQRFTLPLGEFNLQTQGQVDLVNRQIKVTTYAPFFAIAEEALGPIKTGLTGKLDIINRNTLVPITTKGPIDNPSTGIDADAFLKEIGKNVIQQPAETIGNVLGDLLGGKKKDKDKDDQKK